MRDIDKIFARIFENKDPDAQVTPIKNETNHCQTYLLIKSSGFEKNQEVSNEIFFVFR